MMILAFAGILTAVFAGLVSGVTGNLFFKSYLVLFDIFFPLFPFFDLVKYELCICRPSALSVLMVRDISPVVCVTLRNMTLAQHFSAWLHIFP